MGKTVPWPAGAVEWSMFNNILGFIGPGLYVLQKNIWDRKKVWIRGQEIAF